jgi:AraC family transcriptional regulator
MQIVNLKPKILVGMNDDMSIVDDTTFDLWHAFMPNKKHIKNVVGKELFSLQVFTDDVTFYNFTEHTVFTKWACVEVESLEDVPENMDVLMFEGGMYLVEEHCGPSYEVKKTYSRIFKDIIPFSNFSVDKRPHFELLGENYLGRDPNSKEDIWIPIVFENHVY